mmetsp:Transcript_15759/g.23191  ORF Transcript_15759/g.23191 Transcript_15759/m.23191 type:complete len:387 (-) Transcript_15759:1175-2335(-)
MTENAKSNNGNGGAGSLQKAVTEATDILLDSVSSLANSALEEGQNRVNDFSLTVCEENLKKMAMQQSIVTAYKAQFEGINSFGGKVVMSPMIDAMLRVCPLTVGAGFGCTWVVCAPTDQGKTLAAQFLIHGNHSLRPKRSLKIDATNMVNFAKDFAACLNCSAAEDCMSQTICLALAGADTDTDTTPKSDTAEGKMVQAAARVTARATDLAGKYVCNGGNAIAFSTLIEMRDAAKHKTLTLKPVRKDGEPSPILIIDEFYCKTEENKSFMRTLIRDANAAGVVVFLMTKDEDWASQMIRLSGGTKCKPLPTNVDNQGYSGAKRFSETEEAKWNKMFWSVGQLRDLIRPFCEEHNLDPDEVVHDNEQVTPGEAAKAAVELQVNQQLM